MNKPIFAEKMHRSCILHLIHHASFSSFAPECLVFAPCQSQKSLFFAPCETVEFHWQTFEGRFRFSSVFLPTGRWKKRDKKVCETHSRNICRRTGGTIVAPAQVKYGLQKFIVLIVSITLSYFS